MLTEMPYKIYHYPSPGTLARAAAQRWREHWHTVSENRSVALSGGRIAGAFFAEARQLESQKSFLGATHFFWADERCVPPADPESNFLTASRELFVPLRIPEERIHRIRGESPPETAAAQAEEEVRGLLARPAGSLPILDLVFLGMGEDGHIASLFPGGRELPSKAVYAAVRGPKPPPDRITLTYAALAAAREVWVLASGPGKEGALAESLKPAGATPLARLIQARQRTSIFTDIV